MRSDPSRGAALVLFLGVAAAVMLVAAAMIVLLMNTQKSTASERQRTKAFNVAEAALDVAMDKLGQNWPTSATATTWFDAASFAAQFPADEFAGSDSADPLDFVQVRLTDNTDATKSFDYDEDGLVFVDAQARVGNKSARVHAEVEAIYFKPNAMRGLALWAGGDVLSNGGDPKVTVEVFPPGSTECSWAAVGQADAAIGAPYMNRLQGANAPSRQSVLSDEKIEELKVMAQNTGRYFTSVTGPAATVQGYSGLCVIEASSGHVPLIGNASINSEDQPGILLVLGGAGIEFGGTTQFYGIVYCAGDLIADRAHGTPVIHGMMIVEGSLTDSGTPDIRYNDKCVRGLNNQFPIGSRLVPGYWRELTPTM